jgi:hypothetical protein
MTYRCAVLLATIITIGVAPAAHSLTDREKLGKLLREAAPRIGTTVLTPDVVSEALQRSKTPCVCFDSEQNAALGGFVVFLGPQSPGEGFTALCLTPAFGLDGSVIGGTGTCADFTPIPTKSTP